MIFLPSPIAVHVRPALDLLLRANEYATQCNADRWQFATPLADILGSGATLTDVRWLIHRGFAEHAKETTIPGDPQRSFRPLTPTTFPVDTCVVLSPTGAAEIRAALELFLTDNQSNGAISRSVGMPIDQEKKVGWQAPEWDAERRELRCDGQVVKRYRVPAPNQALILTAFQELSWPHVIDDPLPPEGDLDPKQRLAATIKSLNRNQLTRLIKFHGNGEGLQVYWEAVSVNPSNKARREHRQIDC